MKMVGKYIAIVLSCSVFFASAIQITLCPTDMEGNPIKEVHAGQLFKLLIVVNDLQDNGTIASPEISNTKRFVLEKFSTSRLCRNGTLDQMKFVTTAYTESPGYYQNMKAMIIYDGKQYFSNPIALEVKPNNPSATPKMQQDQNLLIDLQMDKKKAFIGEKIVTTLKIYAKPNLRFEIRPEFFQSSMVKHGKQYHSKTTDRINGQPYDVHTWQWLSYPQKTGHHVLPPLCVDLTIPVVHTIWGGLAQYTNFEQKRISSQRLSLDIESLPKNMSEINLTGKQFDIKLHVNPAVCREKEGITCIVELIGDGDLENISYQQIDSLPSTVHSFFSREVIEEANSCQELTRKKFEFILQPQCAGNIEIPGQQLWYFDTTHQVKKAVKSNSLLLTVLPKNQSNESIDNHNANFLDTQQTMHTNDENTIIVLHEIRKTHIPLQLPWWLFFMLTGSMLPIGLTRIVSRYGYKRQKNVKRSIISQLHQAAALNNYSSLHGILLQFIALRKNIPLGSLDHASIENMIQCMPLTEKQKQEWQQLLQTLISCAFDATNNQNQAYNPNLFRQVEQWIELLDRYL